MESPYAKASSPGAGSLPPPSFVKYIPQGPITWASRVAAPPFREGAQRRPERRQTPAQKAGLAFQKRVRDWAFGGAFIGKIEEGPWFAFEDSSLALHFCQPDFLFDNGTVVVVEAKRSFSADAWWQLRKLYIPVLQKVLPGVAVIPLCVCKSFDPATVIPEPVSIVSDLFDCKPGAFNLLVL